MPEIEMDFWPSDFLDDQVRTPSAILSEQASLLGTKTRNLIEAEVTTAVDGPWFTIRFDIVVPALDNYRYQICMLQHDLQIYPVYVVRQFIEVPEYDLRLAEAFELDEVLRRRKISPPSRHKLNSEKDLMEWLGNLLSSKEMRNILTRLLNLVRTNVKAS
jgi:hypothetical protein